MYAERILKNAESNIKWLNDNIDMIQENYENKYIAIYNSKIIAVDSDLDKLLSKIYKSNIDINWVKIEYIRPKKMACIL